MRFPFQLHSYEQYKQAYKRARNDPDSFWAEVADSFLWDKKWSNVHTADFSKGEVRWFEDAKLNITQNCLDRHLNMQADKPAIIWEPNDPTKPSKTYTYQQLYDEVNLFAHALVAQGIRKGDTVCIYMGMVPELAIAMLACARIGVIHSIIFGGFSAQSIADRLKDANAKCIITADGAFRGAKEIQLKLVVDDALVQCPLVEKVIVLSHTSTAISMLKGRDVWWNEIVQDVIDAEDDRHLDAEIVDSEDPLFILYTSGSTGKPKGVVHSSAGYMVWTTYTFVNVFNYKPEDVLFCTADIGWITGHSYIVYGPLCAGATSIMFEGIPTWPNPSRYWETVEKYNATIFYTSPTAIRSLMQFREEFVAPYKMDSLRVLGSVGEPINREAWEWLHKNVGKERCPIVDTWWQTETGGFLISNMANVTPQKPTFATLPLPGVIPVLVDEKGNTIVDNEVHGNLCIEKAWPATIRTTYGDHDRYKKTYFLVYPNKYYTGDGAYRDKEGFYRITGRVDDVLNVSGHRIGTAEVENAIGQHQGVVESAVVGFPHPIKGDGIYAFVVYDKELLNEGLVRQDIIATVVRVIGPICKIEKIQFAAALPKTRSGKIMRRILRKIAAGDESFGDLSTLVDSSVIMPLWENRIRV